MRPSQENSISSSGDGEEISADSVTSGIEVALIMLKYLSADTLNVDKDREKEVSACKIVKYYRAACHALEVGILMMEQADMQRKAA